MEEQIFETNGVKALVVDDNEVNILVVTTMLEQFNIKVDSAYSGKTSIEKAKKENYDIIFMDYLMPEMDGIEATREIRSLGKVMRPAIIALTANVTNEIKRKFTGAGVDDVMAKPLALEAICYILRKWLPYDKIEDGTKNQFNDGKLYHEELNNVKGIDELKEVLEQVEELDVELGLSHLANHIENYVKILEAAIENIQLAIKRLQQLNASQALVSSMKIEFHSLKGVFVNIGSLVLSDQSYLLELAAGDRDEEYIKDKFNFYIESVENFVMKLSNALKRYGIEKECINAYVPMEPEEYDMYMDDLIYHLKRFEFNELQELSEQLLLASQGTQKEKMKRVTKEIQNFQYEKALELLQA